MKMITRKDYYKKMRDLDVNSEFSVILSETRDKCIKRGRLKDIISIKSKNKKIEEALVKLFKNNCNLQYNLKLWIREIIKYGDFFVRLNVDAKKGIKNFLVLPIEEIHREEGYEGKPGSVRFRWETTNDYFEDWQIVHFRTIECVSAIPYGRSVFNFNGKLKGEEKAIISDVQDSMIQGLKKMAMIHLYFLGFKEEIDNFSINFKN